MKLFKPMLTANKEPDLDTDVTYPKLASVKLDGIRCIFKDGKMLTRALKEMPSKHLQEKFEPLKAWSKEHNVILDGEIYDHTMTFQDIISWCMTHDRSTDKKVKQLGEYCGVPDTLKFKCFDALKVTGDGPDVNEAFQYRLFHVSKVVDAHTDLVDSLEQVLVHGSGEVKDMFERALDDGYEGLILKDENSKYKFGRTTIREDTMFKVKPFETFDGKIIDVIERMENTSESYKNELGQSQKHRCKDDMVPTGIASAFLVEYEDKEVKVSLGEKESWRREVWEKRHEYIGQWIEYKGMLVGAKDVPRHPGFIRMRESKD